MSRWFATWQAAVASSFARNSLALISGTVLTQAIVFLCSPFLSRIFSLANFGDLANYNAWVSILALLSSLRYEHAIIVARDARTTNRVIALTVSLIALSVTLYAIFAVLIYFRYDGEGYLQDLKRVVYLIPFGVLPASLASVFAQLNTQYGRFRRVAIVSTVQVVLTVLSQVLLGILHVPNGLILGTILGFGTSATVYFLLAVRDRSLRHLAGEFSLPQLRLTAREFSNFPRYTMPADAINVVVQQSIPVFVLALFSPVLAGMYAFSTRVIRVPLLIISTAVLSALRKEAMDRLHRGQGLRSLFRKTVQGLLAVSLIPFAAMMLYSEEIFALVFGEKWRAAGGIVRILSPGILAEFIAFPLAAFFLVTNTQRLSFRVQLVGFIALAVSLFVGSRFLGGFTATCYLISGVMVIANVTSIALASRVTRSTIAHPIPSVS